ncbi:MAG: hypothetical protein V7724_01410 [Sediminicola sp.]
MTKFAHNTKSHLGTLFPNYHGSNRAVGRYSKDAFQVSTRF